MEAFRRSVSFQRHRRSDSESRLVDSETSLLRRSEEHDRDSLAPRPRSSFDTFVIPNRTRYPSDKTRISEPTSIDFHIAASLLNRAQSDPSNTYANTSTLPNNELSPNYVDSYNATAKRFGLSEMSNEHEQEHTSRRSENDGAADTPSKVTTKKSLFQRLSRKHSVTTMTPRRSASTTKNLNLEEICRFGGVSVLSVAPAFAAAHMVIPTALAATAEHLLQHGRTTPGIFRIPGQSTVVQAIYDYYQARLTPADGAGTIETTICSTDLPTHIQYNVHDIASTFKRFLWDLPGGILGSSSTFKALAEIEAPPVTKLPSPDDSESLPRSKLIALAILSIQSQQRLALVCAVFALLAYLKQDMRSDVEGSSIGSSAPVAESMSPRAFGVVFAPILLGNLSDEIEFRDGRKTSEISSNNSTPKRGLLSGKKGKKVKSSDCGPEIAAGVSRANAAAAVIEMLVRDWEEIVLQIRALQGQPISRAVSRSSRLYMPKHRDGHDALSAHRRPSVPSLRPKRSTSLTKSISHPNIASFSRSTYQDSTIYPGSGTSIYANGQESSSLSRSASVSNATSIRHDIRAGSGSRNFSYSSSALQSIDERARWPSLHLPGDRAPVRSSGGSGESAPWWERSSSEDTGPTTVAFPAPPPSPIRKSPIPAYNKIARDRVRDDSSSDANRASTVTDENSKLPTVHLNDASQAVKFEQPTSASEGDKTSAQMFHGLPAPVFQKMLSPKGSLDSVLSPLYKADRASMAKASYRSLQHDAHESSTEKASSMTPTTRSSPVLNRHYQRTPQSASRQGPSPLQTVPSGKESKRTPRPTPSPLTVELSGPSDNTTIPGSDNTIKSKRSRLEANSPRRQRLTEPSEDSTYDDIRKSNPHTVQSRHQLYEHRQAAFRTPQLLPLPAEPEVARRLNFRSSTEQISSRNTSSEYSSGGDLNQRASMKLNIGTLYAEIRSLKSELDARYDENLQLRQQLDAMRRFKDSGTLAEELRETDRQLKFWMNRAQWAENNLKARNEGREKQGSGRRS